MISEFFFFGGGWGEWGRGGITGDVSPKYFLKAYVKVIHNTKIQPPNQICRKQLFNNPNNQVILPYLPPSSCALTLHLWWFFSSYSDLWLLLTFTCCKLVSIDTKNRIKRVFQILPSSYLTPVIANLNKKQIKVEKLCWNRWYKNVPFSFLLEPNNSSILKDKIYPYFWNLFLINVNDKRINKN